MTNKFYQPGAERAARVNDLFAALAARYDLINDWQSLGLHRWWKRVLIDTAAVRPGERALDVCCGTGDLALRLERAGAETTGLDFSAAMLEVARRRAAERGARTQWLEGDALRLPFEEGRFDIVTVGYGLRNLASLGGRISRDVARGAPGREIAGPGFRQAGERAVARDLFRVSGARGAVVRAPVLPRCRHARLHPGVAARLPGATRGVAAKLAALGCRDVKTRNFLGGAMSLSFGRKG